MNAQALLDKFPDLEHCDEDNHLNDMCCPECGERDSISIEATSWFDIYPDGTDQNGDVEWDDTSGCKCRSCNHDATVADFTFAGLDELIEAGQPEST